MGEQPHALVVPLPSQGHVMPFMELSHRLVDHGVKVTFVNTEFIHEQLMTALPAEKDKENNQIRLISVPDGMEPVYNRNVHFQELSNAMSKVMRGHIEDLIRKFNESDGGEEKITCVIGDPHIGWVLDVAEKMGIESAAFWPAAVSVLAATLQIPKLIQAQIIDENGTPTKNEIILPSSTLPTKSTAFLWNCSNIPIDRKLMFELSKSYLQGVKPAKWILCNSIHELEPASCNLIPGILTIGPLLTTNRLGKSAGHFWQEDSSCLSWLDEQPICSVIYIAFGSVASFRQQEVDELVRWLEFVDRPFLWVVRPGLIDATAIDGFRTRMPHHGKIVNWAPQQKVLAHPSIACFLSHCGWNSTMEGLSSGTPFLCWPQFVDQFNNQSYICDIWKIGLGLNPDENGVISSYEIKRKVEKLLCDEGIKAKAMEIKEMARASINEGGSSWKNLQDFLDQIKK